MIVTLKLFATLSVHLPPEARRDHAFEAEVPEGITVLGMIERFRIPRALCAMVLLNGVFVPLEALGSRTLSAGDALAIWPPVGGG